MFKPDYSLMTSEDEPRLVISPELWRATDELDEFWGTEVNIIEELYQQLVDLRGIDPGHKFFQVFVGPFEPKSRESGEDKASWQKWRLGFQVGT